MNRLIDFFARQGVFSNLITLVILVVGIMSIVNLRREAFPNINFDVLQVITIYPGASADETERLITSPLEQEFKEVDGIKKMMSSSVEGRSIIALQLDPNQTTDDKAKSDIQDVVDRWGDLPEDAEEPIVVILESKNRPVVEVSLAGDISEDELRSTAKMLEREIEKLRDVARVDFSGLRDYEIKVEARPDKLQRYQLSLDELVNALKRQNVSIPGGTMEALDNDSKEIIIRTVGEFKTVEDVRNTVVRANDLGEATYIKDVAKVTKGFVKRKLYNRTNGLSAINLTVVKKENGDSIRLVDMVKERVGNLRDEVDSRISISYINDSSYFVRRRLNVLSNNLGIGLVFVVLFLALILPMRVALITSFGIPFSFLGAMIIFYYSGVSLNLISMMGLIIVVGMLVDDAVVVTENATRLVQEGEDPLTAAIKGTQQVWVPVTASVLTTVVAFLPLMSMSGIMGKFVMYLPMGVLIALLISLYECFFVLPHHIGAWVKPHAQDGKCKKTFMGRILGFTGRIWDSYAVPNYLKLLKVTLRFRYLFLVLGLLFAGFSVYIVKNHMKVVLFPSGQIEFFMINIETAPGTSLERTLELVAPFEEVVSQLPKVEMDDYVTKIGVQIAQSMNDPNQKRGNQYAQILVYLTPALDRDRTAKQIIEGLRERIGSPPGIDKYKFARPSGGPPVGRPINVGIRGRDYSKITGAVQELKIYIKSLPGVTDIEDNYIIGKQELHVLTDGPETTAAGLSVAQVGTTVRAAYEGLVATTVREIDEEVDVRVSYPKELKSEAEALKRLKIPNQRGNLVQLSNIAKIKEFQGIANYEHQENERQVRILGDLDDSMTSAGEVAKKIAEHWKTIRSKHPGTRIYFGGEDEDTKESMESLKRAFSLAILGILVILIMTFKNIHQPLLVLLTVPMGVLATIWTFFIHGVPFSFLGMIGAVALGGVIVNNAIVFMDFVNQLRRQGMDRWQSIFEAGRLRIRPIFLTTITTSCGVLPTAYGVGGLDQFVVPIALALGWGVLIGSFLTTLVFPVALAISDDLIEWSSKLFGSRGEHGAG